MSEASGTSSCMCAWARAAGRARPLPRAPRWVAFPPRFDVEVRADVGVDVCANVEGCVVGGSCDNGARA